ncbi:MAG: methyl-accepting chemotaxis protein [Verrucomicrobia bacterium]|nr:methyl-accepting chemotaxis protein [Verrucomicrobiota bacterium]MBU4246824.1 methyl-accepting chemotaxis protein [Verrucomicrobiota bacterium]MBU4291818.1 methyl-accepting chemotaxis protein [Verrucomicrobiota bacterium]MBU4429420.1 methyl-accepting chemotaxis protein [Verrucomicrobiota bacterium]MCG2680817.1 methyl-accepting chemotaxis protein [Kiritimatiellia bacterium]
MHSQQSITFQLSLLIISSVALIFALVFGYNYYISRQLVMQGVEREAQQIARATLKRIETVLYSVQKVVQGMSQTVQNMACPQQDLVRYLKAVVESNPEVYGSVIAFEPYTLASDVQYFCPYYCKQDGKLTYVDLGNASYNYLNWAWYTTPKSNNCAVWSDPYFDEGGGNIVLTTYSVPFYAMRDAGKRFQGVVTADLSLDWLKDLFASIRIYQTGYAFLISNKGTFIAHPDAALVMKETIFSVANKRKNLLLEQVGRRMVNGDTGFIPMKCLLTNKDCFLYYAPLAANGWSLGVLFPRAEFMADVNRLNQVVLILTAIGFFLLLAVIILVARSITRPLTRLTEAAEAVAEGRLGDASRLAQEMAGRAAGRKVRNEVLRLRQAITTMIHSLESVVSQMGKSGVLVTASRAQIDTSARQLESAVTQQAASINEAGATSKEISTTTQQLAQTMDQVTQSATETATLAGGGVTSLADMKTAVQSLMESTPQIAAKLGLISQKTSNINQVVVTIVKVANQTNLLSLNASIEADKAGEYGLGFSVVASEIRRLADQTAVAALDIENMVAEMRTAVSEGVAAVGNYTSQAQISSEKIVKLSDDLSRIIDQTQQLSARFETVNESMQTQSQGARQINEAMEQLGETARLTHDALSEFKKVTEQMSDAVCGLQSEVARFSVRA